MSMQTSKPDLPNPLIQNLSEVAASAFKELESTKLDLKEKEMQLREIAEISNQKINAAAKLNQDLQGKVDLLQDLSQRLEEQNDELNRRNQEMQIKEKTYNNLNQELRAELEKVTVKEKELEICPIGEWPQDIELEPHVSEPITASLMSKAPSSVL